MLPVSLARFGVLMTQLIFRILVCLASILCSVTPTLAQVATPAGAPASLPATGPTTRPPYRATEPPGFKRQVIEGRTFFLREVDAGWVQQVVASLSPTTRPTTMPADMVERAAANRNAIRQSIVTDLGLTDPAAADDFYDNKLMPMLRQLEAIHPQIIYLVTDAKTLRDVVKGGWENPHFYYNRVADKVAVSFNVAMESGDESVLPLSFDPESTEESRRTSLAKLISETELRVMESVAQRAFELTLATFLQFIGMTAFEPLKAKPDQEWLAVGTSGVLSARYAAPIIGVAADQIINGMSTDDPRNPIRAGTIDLLHPNDLQQMRQQFVPAYLAAFRARSMQAARLLLERTGSGGVAKILAAWKQAPPADGPALVNLIKQSTGVDMSGDLGPR